MDKVAIGARLREIRENIMRDRKTNTTKKMSQEKFYEQYLADKGLFREEHTRKNSRAVFMSALENGTAAEWQYTAGLLLTYSEIGNVPVEYILTGGEYKKSSELKTYSDVFEMLFRLYELRLVEPIYDKDTDTAYLKIGKGSDLLVDTSFPYHPSRTQARYILYQLVISWEQALGIDGQLIFGDGNDFEPLSYFEMWKDRILQESSDYPLNSNSVSGKCPLIDRSLEQIRELDKRIKDDSDHDVDYYQLAADILMGSRAWKK